MATQEVTTEALNPDPNISLPALRDLRALITRLEPVHVLNARAIGWTWEQIANNLGVSRQTLHEKYRHRDPQAKAKKGRRS